MRGLSKLQKIVHDEFVAHSGRKETTSTPRSSASDVSERDDARDQVNDNTDQSQNEQRYSPPQHRPGNSSYAGITERGKKIAIVSDSMCKHVDIKGLNRALENKEAYKRIFLGATAADINYYSMRTLIQDRPDISVIHAGTNNIGKDDPFNIAKEVTEIVNSCKLHGCERVFVSGIMLNNILYQWSFLHDYTFIDNDNIRNDCLARDDLHVNYKGAQRLTANFRRALGKPYV